MWRTRVLVRGVTVLTAAALLTATSQAQRGDQVFDVVSIKPARNVRGNRSAAPNLRVQPGRVWAPGITAQGLISIAFPSGDTRRLPERIVGGPDWLATQQFEFIATTHPEAPETTVSDQLPALVRSALADRFQLKGHLEIRPVPIFVLARAHRNGTLGPLLRPTAPGTYEWSSSGREFVSASYLTMGQLASRLTSINAAGRVVVDRTGLTGPFDVELYWSPERTAVSGPVPPEVDGASLFTAVQEQLGLKLEARTEPQDVYVVDSIQHPDPN
jgi:uncharacterized protein (TIGR03435 family)